MNADSLHWQHHEDDLQQQNTHNCHSFLSNKHTELLWTAVSWCIYCSFHHNAVFQHICSVSVYVQINEESKDTTCLQSASEHLIWDLNSEECHHEENLHLNHSSENIAESAQSIL